MPRGCVATPSSVEIQNFGGVTLHIVNFDGIGNQSNGRDAGPGAVYNSSLNAIVGYWFHATDAPTQTNEGVDVSLLSVTTGQFRFTYGEKDRDGKLYILTLT